MIDVTFDFTRDSYRYWEGFWNRKDGLGAGFSDPDSSSPTLQEYHRILWSKELPNGEIMDLKSGSGSYYLTWKDYRFGSDSIIVSFRYYHYKEIIEQAMAQLVDYKAYYEDFLHKSYTIGGMIIFPKHNNSINQNKGTNKLISDRFDLTLECIRRFYFNEPSPLSDVLEQDRKFFEVFVDFKGYVDFFFLQDCVSSDYNKVIIWDGKGDFTENPLPKTVEDYFHFLDNELDFLQKRNARIREYAKSVD
ncbi:DUF6994 family protein [Pseudobutyrivibrio ruminis]|nr:hypothetical protein [Pseudobutyrivibrio ruminis]